MGAKQIKIKANLTTRDDGTRGPRVDRGKARTTIERLNLKSFSRIQSEPHEHLPRMRKRGQRSLTFT